MSDRSLDVGEFPCGPNATLVRRGSNDGIERGDIILATDDVNAQRGCLMTFRRGDLTIEGVIVKRHRRRDGSVRLWWEGRIAPRLPAGGQR